MNNWKSFENQASIIIGGYLNTKFNNGVKLLIGNPPKNHKFDLVSSDLKYVAECKCYSWTESDNVPSAKIAHINEAVFYLSFLPKEIQKYIRL